MLPQRHSLPMTFSHYMRTLKQYYFAVPIYILMVLLLSEHFLLVTEGSLCAQFFYNVLNYNSKNNEFHLCTKCVAWLFNLKIFKYFYY